MSRMTAEQYRNNGEAESKNKYGAKKITLHGIKFDSKREANRWLILRQQERDGKIRNLRLQEKIFLQGRDGPILTRSGRKMRITVDFTYIDCATGMKVYEDSKGYRTRDYEVRLAVAAAQGVEVVET